MLPGPLCCGALHPPPPLPPGTAHSQADHKLHSALESACDAALDASCGQVANHAAAVGAGLSSCWKILLLLALALCTTGLALPQNAAVTDLLLSQPQSNSEFRPHSCCNPPLLLPPLPIQSIRYSTSSGLPPGTMIATWLPLSRIESSFVIFFPSGVYSISWTSSSTMFT
jgi:hypothetical protein